VKFSLLSYQLGLRLLSFCQFDVPLLKDFPQPFNLFRRLIKVSRYDKASLAVLFGSNFLSLQRKEWRAIQ